MHTSTMSYKEQYTGAPLPFATFLLLLLLLLLQLEEHLLELWAQQLGVLLEQGLSLLRRETAEGKSLLLEFTDRGLNAGGGEGRHPTTARSCLRLSGRGSSGGCGCGRHLLLLLLLKDGEVALDELLLMVEKKPQVRHTVLRGVERAGVCYRFCT